MITHFILQSAFRIDYVIDLGFVIDFGSILGPCLVIQTAKSIPERVPGLSGLLLFQERFWEFISSYDREAFPKMFLAYLICCYSMNVFGNLYLHMTE